MQSPFARFGGALGGVIVLASLAVALTGSAVAVAASGTSGLAATLRQLDPGALIGAPTQVETASGAKLRGVPGAEFAAGLGRREAIAGGGGTDQLAAFGAGSSLRGGAGRDQLRALGPDATLSGGSGPDLLEASGRGATLNVAGADWVVAAGAGSRVECSAHVAGAVIFAGLDDRVDPACARNGASLRRPAAGTLRSRPLAGPAALVSQVSGDGGNGNPFVAPCDDAAEDPCTVSSFAPRQLSGFWANEYVPAYVCPADHPWLVNVKYAPVFTVIPNGVEIRESSAGGWAISISISGQKTYKDRFSGTATGFPNSSATSGRTDANSYQVVLHCTANCDRGYDNTGSHPCTTSASRFAILDRRGAARPTP